MKQLIIPIIPQGATQINNLICVYRNDEKWTYFAGIFPIHSHHPDDLRMFRLITSSLIDAGACRQRDIIRTFGVSKSSVIRSVKKYRQGGSSSFFEKRGSRRGGKVLTDEVLLQAQQLLDTGMVYGEVASEFGIHRDTLRKAIEDGRLKRVPLSQPPQAREELNTKSDRDVIDTEAAQGMGTACTRVNERVLAAFGVCEGAPVRFEPCLDVPNGGVLCALPGLLANGLLTGIEKLLDKAKGYYTTFHILLLLAFMALCRIRTVEQLRGYAPGEFGKMLGLDRIPEVRCLRQKLDALCANHAAERWAEYLGRYWLQSYADTVGTLYVDGHVRLYHGRLTQLPRRYVSRERLCLRGTTDYWVNDAIGQPFFVVEKTVDRGLLQVLQHDIVPRLLDDIVHQPSAEELETHPYRCRFVLVFDREGYSPSFFQKMWHNHRVACITYHKHPEKKWPEDSFIQQHVIMPNGEKITMKLAERGSLVGSGKKPLWMREVRKLTASGHQTSMISTAYEVPHTQLAARMFSRWCQENFFQYMMRHFALDLLQEYGVEDLPDTEKIINPTWRELSRSKNALQNKLRYRQAAFATISLHPAEEGNNKKYRSWSEKKAELLEEIEQYDNQISEIKGKLKETEKHISLGELADKDKFQRLLPNRKRLMDTVRMIAYRTETAMTTIVIGPTVNLPEARKLLQNLYVTEVDILPEPEKKILRIRVHSASWPGANKSIEKLIRYLNETEVKYPGTDMIIVYELRAMSEKIPEKVSDEFPRDQDS